MSDAQRLYYLNLIIKQYLNGYKYIIFVDINYEVYIINIFDKLTNDEILTIIEAFKNELKDSHYRFIKNF